MNDLIKILESTEGKKAIADFIAYVKQAGNYEATESQIITFIEDEAEYHLSENTGDYDFSTAKGVNSFLNDSEIQKEQFLDSLD